MKSIKTANALKANGHYSQAIEHQGIIYISGILPISCETGMFVEGDITSQAKAVFQNLNSILEAADSEKKQVLRTTIYIPDIELWDKVDAVYAEFFGEHKPARTIVPTNRLHFGSYIEMEAIAYKK